MKHYLEFIVKLTALILYTIIAFVLIDRLVIYDGLKESTLFIIFIIFVCLPLYIFWRLDLGTYFKK